MFKSQEILANNWGTLSDTLARYEGEAGIENLKPQVDHFVMKVPLVGVFSAGKSSLLNTLLDEKLLSIQISPETAIATEFHYTAGEEQMIGHLASGDTMPISRDRLKTQDLKNLTTPDQNGKQGWVEARLNKEVLSQFPHVALVDLPGLDSNLISHNDVIDSYIQQSLAYAIVVSVEDGDVRESTQHFLEELNLAQMPVILVLTKSDLKAHDDLTQIQQKMEASVTKLLGRPPLKTVMINRKGENIDQLVSALTLIENKSETRFNQTISAKVLEQLSFTQDNLDKLLDMDDVTIESLQAEKQHLKEQMQAFEDKINKDGQHLQSQADRVIRNIGNTVEDDLMAKLETLANQVLDNRDVNVLVNHTVRTSVARGVHNELEPLVKAYVDNVEANLPDSIQVDSPSIEISEAEEDGFSYTGVALKLAPLLLLKSNPILAVISTALPVIGEIFDMFKNDSQKQAERQAKIERAKDVVMTEIIPQVSQNTAQVLHDVVSQNINSAMRAMQDMVVNRAKQVNAQIEQKEKDIQASEEKRQANLDQYAKDKALLADIEHQLQQAMATA